jgi:DNA-binding HxlR family transcriptional regulator
MEEELNKSQSACDAHHRAIQDTMDIVSGKWKLRIVGSLTLGKKRFLQLSTHIEGHPCENVIQRITRIGDQWIGHTDGIEYKADQC